MPPSSSRVARSCPVTSKTIPSPSPPSHYSTTATATYSSALAPPAMKDEVDGFEGLQGPRGTEGEGGGGVGPAARNRVHSF